MKRKQQFKQKTTVRGCSCSVQAEHTSITLSLHHHNINITCTRLLTAATTLQTSRAKASRQHVLTLKNTFSMHFAYLAILFSYKLSIM